MAVAEPWVWSSREATRSVFCPSARRKSGQTEPRKTTAAASQPAMTASSQLTVAAARAPETTTHSDSTATALRIAGALQPNMGRDGIVLRLPGHEGVSQGPAR